MAVALTTLLVLYTLFSQTSEALPSTAYVKMIDIWFFTVITLLFIIIVFHVIVEYIDQKIEHTKNSSQDENYQDAKKFEGPKVAWMQTEEEEQDLPERLMKTMRVIIIPAIFVVFNATFWAYWFL